MAVFDRERSQSVSVEERIAAADALGRAGDPRLDMSREDSWVTIPAGKFLMGAQSKDERKPNYDPEAYDDEGPVHEVSLDAFRIARFPVTVGQYKQFMDDDGYKERRWWQAGGFGEFSGPVGWEEQVEYASRPVVAVGWWEAMAYCAWAGYQLPTEAQWERTARGTDGRKYPWGNDEPDAAGMDFNVNVGNATPVGIFPLDATPEGVLDMGGNVCEWCRDGSEDYKGGSLKNPCGTMEAASRAYRGGSWVGGARNCRAASRYRDVPLFRFGILGFRMAAVPLSQSSQEPAAEPPPEQDRRNPNFAP